MTVSLLMLLAAGLLLSAGAERRPRRGAGRWPGGGAPGRRGGLLRRRRSAGPTLALTLDLIAVALRAGQPLDAAVLLAAPAAGSDERRLTEVGRLLRLGADPEAAWGAVADDPVLGQVGLVAVRSAANGIRLAAAFERLAAELRARARARAEHRAQRAGVLAAAPLGLCFLPSFVCLGVVPVVVGVAGAALAGV